MMIFISSSYVSVKEFDTATFKCLNHLFTNKARISVDCRSLLEMLLSLRAAVLVIFSFFLAPGKGTIFKKWMK